MLMIAAGVDGRREGRRPPKAWKRSGPGVRGWRGASALCGQSLRWNATEWEGVETSANHQEARGQNKRRVGDAGTFATAGLDAQVRAPLPAKAFGCPSNAKEEWGPPDPHLPSHSGSIASWGNLLLGSIPSLLSTTSFLRTSTRAGPSFEGEGVQPPGQKLLAGQSGLAGPSIPPSSLHGG